MSPARAPRRTVAALLVLVAGWLLAGVVTAAPAAAHASLVGTVPAEDAHLTAPPDKVSLQFSEHISIGPGYARVVTADGRRVDTGTASVTGATLTIPLRGNLAAGGYVVTYRIISADTHPVSGAYSFAVGTRPLPGAQTVKARGGTDPAIAVLLPAARWVGYAGLALALGLPVLLLVCWTAGWASTRVRRLAVRGALAVAVGAIGYFLLQGADAAGSGLSSLLDPALLTSTAGSLAGVLLLARTALALATAGLLAAVFRRGGRPPARWQTAIGGLLGAGLVVTTAAVGHASAGPWWPGALLSTSVHVAAMAVWLGGLTGLLTGVLRPGVPAEQLGVAVPRFSRLAATAVTSLIVTGIVQAIREVGIPPISGTPYGWVLTVKLILLGVVLAAAGVSRTWVQNHYHVPRPDSRRRVTAHAFAATAAPARPGGDPIAALPALRRSVLVELALATAVLAASAVLTGTPPPVTAAAPQPLDVTLPLRSTTGPAGTAEVSLAPARPGTNSLHLYLFGPAGRPSQPLDVQVSVADPAASIGPLNATLLHAGPGHYIAPALTIPGTGTWTLTVTTRLDQFTAATASTNFPVR